jgi:hypothetical protein
MVYGTSEVRTLGRLITALRITWEHAVYVA